MRSIWTGAIGFGLVNIPIKIYSATEESSLNLDMLDKKDHERIRYVRVNEKSGKEVPWENIVKGYNYDGKIVVLDDKDFAKASAEKTKLIEITEFVSESEINSMYYETPYYLQPAKGGEKPYVLLREALKKAGMAGICTYVMRNRESLAIIKPVGEALVLNKIRFAEEIRDVKKLDLPDSKVKAEELKMAVALIKQLTAKFDIEKYKDKYTDALMKVIQAKAKGKKVESPKLRVTHQAKTDLMEQLRESLKKKKAS